MHTFFENRGRIVLFIAVVTGIVLFSIYQKTPTALRGDIVNGYTIECGAEPPNTACSDIDNDSTLECCDDESDPVDGYCIDTGFDGDKCEDDRVKCFSGTCRAGKCESQHSYCNRKEECNGIGACIPIDDFCEKNPGSSDCCTEVDGVEVSEPEISAEVEDTVKGATENKDELQKFLNTPQAYESIKQLLITRKTIQRLSEIAKDKYSNDRREKKK